MEQWLIKKTNYLDRKFSRRRLVNKNLYKMIFSREKLQKIMMNLYKKYESQSKNAGN